MFLKRDTALYAIKVLVTLLLVGLFLWRVDGEELLGLLLSIRLRYYLPAFVIMFLNIGLLGALRWRILVGPNSDIGFIQFCRLTYIARAFNTVVPGNVAGDVVRGLEVSGDGFSKKSALASVATDRLMALVGMVLASLLGSVWSYRILAGTGLVGYSIGVSVCVLTLTVALYAFPASRIVDKVRDGGKGFLEVPLLFFLELSEFRRKWIRLILALSLSLFSTFVTVLNYCLISRALDLTIPLGAMVSFVPLVTILSALPITVGGLGLRDGAMVVLLGLIGVSVSASVSMTFLYFVLVAGNAVVGALLYLQGSRRLRMERGIAE